ncbi:hypothetical protein K3495_g7735 [Podosphaera aphanis]|nr:hypothetical protein K3495_g7735 [Podosphaera aphanis]
MLRSCGNPLDLAPFSDLKTKYRSEIAALSVPNDAAPTKKERFVVSYNKAEEEGLSERVIRAGWRATGLCPYNPELLLASSQVSQRPTTLPSPGLTSNPPDLILSTPRISQALHKASRELQTVEPLSRGARTLIRKAGKALSEANARAALSEFEKQQAQHQLDSSQTARSRRRIQVNPHERFSDVEAIRDAVDRATTLLVQVASRNVEIEARRDVSGSAGTTLESMCNQWQI